MFSFTSISRQKQAPKTFILMTKSRIRTRGEDCPPRALWGRVLCERSIATSNKAKLGAKKANPEENGEDAREKKNNDASPTFTAHALSKVMAVLRPTSDLVWDWCLLLRWLWHARKL